MDTNLMRKTLRSMLTRPLMWASCNEALECQVFLMLKILTNDVSPQSEFFKWMKDVYPDLQHNVPVWNQIELPVEDYAKYLKDWVIDRYWLDDRHGL